MRRWLGIDVGGANLKAADSHGYALSIPFELWRRRDELSDALIHLVESSPSCDAIAATMTGELADCYQNKAEGVRHITDALTVAAANRRLAIYHVDGNFRDPIYTRERPGLAAASNWHALAQIASRFLPDRTGIVLDIGSTTSDVVPVDRGKVASGSRTDVDRLMASELVYTGVERTPICALVSSLPYRGGRCPVAAELFAATADVYRLLGDIQNDLTSTADGRRLDEPNCTGRLARQICADQENFGRDDALEVCHVVKETQVELLSKAIARVSTRVSNRAVAVIASGSGEFLAVEVADTHPMVRCVLPLSSHVGTQRSGAAAAYAVAQLAEEFLQE